MRRVYLLVYDAAVGNRDVVKGVLNRMKTVVTWRFDIPNCFYVVSEKTAQDLYNEFVSINGTKGRFMFIEASSNRQGQMLPDTWYLLAHKNLKSS